MLAGNRLRSGLTVSTETVPTTIASSQSKFNDFVEITKPRISAMIIITVGISGFVAAVEPNLWMLFNTMVGVFLVAASGSAVNQFIERYTDWLMPRTCSRPLPSQRLSAAEVALFAAITIGVGISYLVMLVSWQAAVVAGVTWILYSWIYTPLKVITSFNTYVGAVAGAMPVLIGVVGATGIIPPIGWALFTILFLWQFPHFMAIAWKYREDYADGGLKMFPVTDPSGRSTAWHALIFAILIFPASYLAIWFVAGFNPIYWIAATILGIIYLVPSVKFWSEQNAQTSRSLILSSIVYLPLMFLLVLIARIF